MEKKKRVRGVNSVFKEPPIVRERKERGVRKESPRKQKCPDTVFTTQQVEEKGG